MKTAENCFREIAEALSKAAPENWQTAWVTALVHDDHAKAEYDSMSDAGAETWFSPGVELHNQIAFGSIELRQLTHQDKADPWNKIIFTLEKSGKFNIDFSYEEEA